jgi:hypothetical protein
VPKTDEHKLLSSFVSASKSKMNVYYTQVDVVLPRPFTTGGIIVSSGGARNTM